MTFHLSIVCDNAAFEGHDREAEIARILRDVADRVDAGNTSGKCRDINGNLIGSFGFHAIND